MDCLHHRKNKILRSTGTYLRRCCFPTSSTHCTIIKLIILILCLIIFVSCFRWHKLRHCPKILDLHASSPDHDRWLCNNIFFFRRWWHAKLAFVRFTFSKLLRAFQKLSSVNSILVSFTGKLKMLCLRFFSIWVWSTFMPVTLYCFIDRTFCGQRTTVRSV